MRTYEALYIVRSDIKDDEIQTVAKDVEQLVLDNEGAIVRSENWGKRKLAYEVKGFYEGCYVLLRFQAKPSFLSKLNNHFRLSEKVIRNIVVYFDSVSLKLEEEQKLRVEEEIRASAAARARRAESDDDEDDEDDAGAGRPYRRDRQDADED